MALIAPTKTPMSNLLMERRCSTWEEVTLGYSEAQARAEALRCLQCQDPVCETGCPVNVPIREFIRLIAQGELDAAVREIKKKNILPAICGRVCPQEHQCERVCTINGKQEPVAVGRLERFVADWDRRNGADHKKVLRVRPNGHRVAIVGSGPAGLTCASDLALMGYQVTIFEALHAVGGVLVYGIPEFRLPKAIVQEDVLHLIDLGVEVRTNTVIGKTVTVDQLFDELGYQAVFVGTGAGTPKFMGIPGENLKGVYSANEFLTRVNLMRANQFPDYDTPIKRGRRVAVIGAGDTAMDCVRTGIRLGAEDARIVYRRSRSEMSARVEDYEHAHEEGAAFDWLTLPIRVLGDDEGWVRGLECQRCELGEPDASGRRRPVAVPGSEFVLDVDIVVMALGTNPNPLIPQTTYGLETNDHGCIKVDEETMATSRAGVYAGGDIVTGSATVILAMGAGRKAAAAIDAYVREKSAGRRNGRP